MSKGILFQPAPPSVTNARMVRGLADGSDGDADKRRRGLNAANEARSAATKHLSVVEAAEIVFTYRVHTTQATSALRDFRLAQTAERKNLLRKLAKQYGVSATAIEVAVGTR